MTFKDRLGQPVYEGDFIIYVTKSEAPSLKFGYIEKIKETSRNPNNNGYVSYSVRVANTDPRGHKLNKKVFGIGPDGEYGYQDTDRLDISILTINMYPGRDEEHRLMVTKPI